MAGESEVVEENLSQFHVEHHAFPPCKWCNICSTAPLPDAATLPVHCCANRVLLTDEVPQKNFLFHPLHSRPTSSFMSIEAGNEKAEVTDSIISLVCPRTLCVLSLFLFQPLRVVLHCRILQRRRRNAACV